MADSIYSKIIAQLRLEMEMNQAEIANLLQISQATVSRIEKNMTIPKGALAEKIRNLPLKQKISEGSPDDKEEKVFDLNKEIKTFPFKPFDVSYLSLGYSKVSGDLCLTKKLTQEKALLFLADCVGHGVDAGKMAFAVRFGLETAVSILNPSAINTTVINGALSAAVDATHEMWVGPPAFASIILDSKRNQARVFNNMQPAPIFFANGEVKDLLAMVNESPLPAHRQEEMVLNMKAGASLLICSDGFLDLFEDSKAIMERFLKSAKAFKGDSKATLLHVLTIAKGVSKETLLSSKSLTDDSSVMIVTRGRD